MKGLAKIKQLLSEPKKIVITTHNRPDGDAIGSSLGLYHFLRATTHDVSVVVPTEYPAYLHFLPDDEKVVSYLDELGKTQELISEADIIFFLDFSVRSRCDVTQQLSLNSSAIKIVIDHHLGPEHFGHYELWDTSASSAAELIYRFIELQDGLTKINEKAAACLYTGIVSDTGRFKYNVTDRVHRIATDLVVKGADAEAINTALFDNYTERRLRFLGTCLTTCMTVLPEYNAAIMAIPEKMLVEFKVQSGDTGGLVNYLLSMSSIRFAALIMDRGEAVKISFRSRGDFPVNIFSKNHFEGGGHKNAAGGISYIDLKATVNKVIGLLPLYKEGLTK
ncbi:MAG: DHH family phosphoesterase [Chitinophagales bacterium]